MTIEEFKARLDEIFSQQRPVTPHEDEMRRARFQEDRRRQFIIRQVEFLLGIRTAPPEHVPCPRFPKN